MEVSCELLETIAQEKRSHEFRAAALDCVSKQVSTEYVTANRCVAPLYFTFLLSSIDFFYVFSAATS